MTSLAAITDQLSQQAIELPSWAFGNSGTRFKVFGTPGTPRTVQEKIADAARVNELTGLAPKVALHIPWDKVDDYTALRRYADDHGMTLGTVNSNTFQDDLYKFGSLTHVDEAVRRKAIDHHFECIEIMHQTGSQDLKIWLADGTNYAGHDLIVGSADPFQLFRILYEVIRGGGYGPESDVAFMLDQCHNVEEKIPGQIRSVLNVQEMTARALLVDLDALARAQEANDVLGAHGILMDAFYTDVRPALAAWRETRGLPADPMAAYAASGYQQAIAAERVGG